MKYVKSTIGVAYVISSPNFFRSWPPVPPVSKPPTRPSRSKMTDPESLLTENTCSSGLSGS